LICALILIGCRPSAVVDTDSPASATTPGNGEIYRVDPAASELHILVYRAGPLARLGHNHVVAARDLAGRVTRLATLEGSGFELFLAVNGFTLDSPQLRERYGEPFSSTPTADDIASTTVNMLGGALLDAAAYPQIRVAGSLRRGADGYTVDVDINVKERTVKRTIPIELEIGQETLSARGSVELSQNELGLTPFSIMLGALRVADNIEIRFDIAARR
jgi:hypothetical protein